MRCATPMASRISSGRSLAPTTGDRFGRETGATLQSELTVNKEYAFGRRQEGVGAITTAYVECTLQIIGGTMIASPSASTYGVVLTFAI